MTSTTKRNAMMDRIRKHGANLIAAFGLDAATDPVKLCKALRRLESKAGANAVRYCNGTISERAYESVKDRILAQVKAVLGGADQVPVFVNGDPRGYALKIDDVYVREHSIPIHRDWGGYGIIAPDLTNDLPTGAAPGCGPESETIGTVSGRRTAAINARRLLATSR